MWSFNLSFSHFRTLSPLCCCCIMNFACIDCNDIHRLVHVAKNEQLNSSFDRWKNYIFFSIPFNPLGYTIPLYDCILVFSSLNDCLKCYYCCLKNDWFYGCMCFWKINKNAVNFIRFILKKKKPSGIELNSMPKYSVTGKSKQKKLLTYKIILLIGSVSLWIRKWTFQATVIIYQISFQKKQNY